MHRCFDATLSTYLTAFFQSTVTCALQNLKQQIRAELDNATRARDSLRAQLREMKGKLEYMTVGNIDEQVRRLEHKMAHSSQSLQEEKKTLDDMKRLKASRSTVQQYNDRFEKLSSDDEGRNAIVQRLQQAETQLKSIKVEEEQLRSQLGDMRSKEAEQKSDIPALIQEREDCRAVINELYSKIKDIRADFKVKQDEYYERQREFRQQQQEEQAERYYTSRLVTQCKSLTLSQAVQQNRIELLMLCECIMHDEAARQCMSSSSTPCCIM